MSNSCILASHDSGGWGNLTAGNPVEVLSRGGLLEIKEFTARHQAAGHLLIGYLSYDFGSRLRGAEPSKPAAVKTPPSMVFAFDSWQENKTIVPPARQDLYESPLHPTISRENYLAAFNKIKSYLEAGDAYQVNLAQRLAGTTELSGLELFGVLSSKSQVNFQAYLDCGSFEILSLSPERFIRTNGRKVLTAPIKGTRPRGRAPAEDKRLRQDLLNSPKDAAELNMITDLLRNDLGEVCEAGSVKVAEARSVTKYSTLWHARSQIEGKLRTGVSPIAALASMSPGGSVTGCPKKRVLEIIDELEPERRGVYTGSIFVIRPDGSLDSSIAIRTIVKQGRNVSLSVGGGIVYDSSADAEYGETLDKAASFLG
jgi:para-aminobenzoate synthetase component 1